MFLDPYDALGLASNGIYEAFQTSLIEAMVKEGDIALDVGAHIGYYTLIFAGLVGDGGKVFAFEPGPDNFYRLRKNVRANRCRNVVIEQKAVSDRNGEAELYLTNTTDHRMFGSDKEKAIEVEVVRLDDYFQDYGERIDLVKIDVEGAEESVVRGMRLLLERNISVKLFTEFWPFGLAKLGTKPEEYLGSLLDLGFTFYDINEEKKILEPATVDKLLKLYPADDASPYTNLLCLRDRTMPPVTPRRVEMSD